LRASKFEFLNKKEGGNLFARITILLVLLALLPLSGRDASASLQQKPPKRILVLYSHDRMLPAHEMMEKGLLSVVTSDPAFNIEICPEYMDSSRFQGPEYLENMARFLGDKYSSIKPNIVMTVFPNALSFFLDYCEPIFPGVPIVGCTILENTARELGQTDKRARTTGVIVKENVVDIVPMARALRPEMRRIALVGGSSDSDKISLTIIRNGLMRYETGMEVLDFTELAMPQIIERVGSLPSDSIVLYSSIFIDGQGQHFTSRQALGMISRAANVPVFSPYESHFGYGIVGGNLLSFEAQGRKAAELAMRILAGESPGDIPFAEDGTTVIMFDWRELKRWGISEASLPDGSIVKYRGVSVWEEHRGQIIGAVAFFFLETLLIVALVFNLQKSRHARKELHASELRYRTVADYTYNWEYWSAPDGTLNYISPVCETITGLAPRQFIGDTSLFREIIIPEDRGVWDEHDHAAVTDPGMRDIQFRIRKTDGGIRWIEHSCRPVIDARGEFLGIRASNRDITARKRAEEKIIEREKDLHKLTGRLIWGQEEERRRLARELHDDLTQRLAVLAIQAGIMEQTARDGNQPVLEDFHDLRDQAVQISADIHNISRRIHPSILDELGLEKAIASECTRFSRREGIAVAFAAEDLPGNLPKNVALSLYRIIQEGLTNIAKYACARHATVTLKGTRHGIFLSLLDDGIGFDPAEVRKKPGLGLSSMRERVRIIRGKLRITSEPEKGTTILVNVPLKGENSS
jgi:PAS domain S-box-containing protein